MIDEGFIIKDEHSHKYGISVKFFYLGNLYKNNFNIVDVTRKYLKSLADEFGQATFITLDIDGCYTIADSFYPPNNKSSVMYDKPGSIMPKNCTADGKIFLSQYPDEQIRQIFAVEGFFRGTEKSICDIETYLEEINKVRKQGYAINNGETMLYLGAIAVPVYDRYKRIVASLAVGVPPDEQTPDYIHSIVLALQQAASLINKELP